MVENRLNHSLARNPHAGGIGRIGQNHKGSAGIVLFQPGIWIPPIPGIDCYDPETVVGLLRQIRIFREAGSGYAHLPCRLRGDPCLQCFHSTIGDHGLPGFASQHSRQTHADCIGVRRWIPHGMVFPAQPGSIRNPRRERVQIHREIQNPGMALSPMCRPPQQICILVEGPASIHAGSLLRIRSRAPGMREKGTVMIRNQGEIDHYLTRKCQ
ncbi:MAG: hypothetical protein BWY82_02606 [Verrucomicrobia bacterium ADurb.Bin474]|nr:MAG: hypothetical protein BWY82_02606 [Verrucomicrobia bacterium ADurb.Bin474]